MSSPIFTRGEDKLDLRALGVTDFAAQVSRQTFIPVNLDGDGFDYADSAIQLNGHVPNPEGVEILF